MAPEVDMIIEQLVSSSLPDVSTLIHHMPCSIARSGEAPVSDFFLTTIEKEDGLSEINATLTEKRADAAVDGGWSPNDGQHFSASFRGRPLNGTQLDLRPNYAGLILEQSLKGNQLYHGSDSFDESPSCTTWKPVAQFKSLTYWNWDKKPSDEDSIQQMLQWSRLSQAMTKSARSELQQTENTVDSDVES